MTNDIIVRKDVRSLSPKEKRNFVDAVKALKANIRDKKLGDNRYDDYVIWHAQTMMMPAGNDDSARMGARNLAHMGPIFLPWHREFLRRFELDLRKEVSDVSIPYWDWAFDSTQSIEESPVWKEDFMGGNGDPNNDNLVMDGPFKGWITQELDERGNPTIKDKLRRNFGNAVRTLPSLMDVYSAFQYDFYDTPYWDMFSRGFRNALEGWPNGPQLHNRVHVWVGGSMELSTSPNDPVFFLNHSNVDRLWALWQDIRFDWGYPPDGTIVDRTSQRIKGFNLNDKMHPWENEANSKTIAGVLDYRQLGYKYDK